ncbi:hypothetical protein NEOLEDRAFT_276228, partial [Neolentinus lepideus HHB14362 ss-1]
SNKHPRPATASEILARTHSSRQGYSVPPLQHPAMIPTTPQNPQHLTAPPSYYTPTSAPVMYYPYYPTTPHIQHPYNIYYSTPMRYSMPYCQYSPPPAGATNCSSSIAPFQLPEAASLQCSFNPSGMVLEDPFVPVTPPPSQQLRPESLGSPWEQSRPNQVSKGGIRHARYPV